MSTVGNGEMESKCLSFLYVIFIDSCINNDGEEKYDEQFFDHVTYVVILLTILELIK